MARPGQLFPCGCHGTNIKVKFIFFLHFPIPTYLSPICDIGSGQNYVPGPTQ